MGTDNNTSSGGHTVTSFLLVGLCGFFAVLLAILALVEWLARVLDSITWATLIVAVFFAVIAVIIYFASVRSAVKNIQDKLDTVYDVANTAKTGYEWIIRKKNLIVNLWEELHNS